MHRLLTILFLFVTSTICSAQIDISGTVVSNRDGELLPGVSIVELGTKNGTTTDMEGKFHLSVSDLNARLEIRFIGFIPKQVELDGKDSISIKLKIDCHRDFFDRQSISVFALSGVINNPIGAELDFAFPYFSRGALIAGFSYQSDFDEKHFINGKIEYKHFIFNCDFDVDLNWYHKFVNFTDSKSSSNSFEANFNYRRYRLTAGYSHLNIENEITNVFRNYSAPLVGLGTWINTAPVQTLLTAKVALYGNTTEIMGQARFNTKYVEFFVNYYRLNSFSELTIGVGKKFGY